MARPPRRHVINGHFHVTIRGNHREPLFGSHGDRAALNEIVEEAVARHGAQVHAYCWMTNHLHALVQTTDLPLGEFMQRIAMRYSRYRHRRLRTTGHLFERRYGARLIDNDSYFLTALRYVHLNPCQAGLVSDPADYPWSSHAGYLGRPAPAWLTTAFALSLFHPDRGQAARLAYTRFLGAALGDEDLALARARDASGASDEDPIRPRALTRAFDSGRATRALTDIAARVCRERLIDPATLRVARGGRHLTLARLEVARQAIDGNAATLREVARFLGRSPSALSQLLARYRL